jgi:hypothetical protein
VGRFTEEDHLRLADALQQRVEVHVTDVGDRLGDLANQGRGRRRPAASGWSGGRDDGGLLPGVLAHERDEADVSQVLLVEPLAGDARHPDEVL